jgi:tRNA (mo5U34)-methyltransferase
VTDLREQIESIVWHHRIDLGDGVVTPGLSTMPMLGPDLMPDLTGRTVLDIGAWDGYYSFQAERLGAARVVALDHYAWGVDLPARTAYWNECHNRGVLPDHGRDTTDFWRPDLPGRRGFDLARSVLDSAVEPVVGNFLELGPDDLDGAPFDVVLFLGVLYHVKDPLLALERVRALVREVAVIETDAVWVYGLEGTGLSAFFDDDGLAADFGNWFSPNEKAMVGLCRSAGFSRVRVVVGPPVFPHASAVDRLLAREPALPRVEHYRLAVHAFV